MLDLPYPDFVQPIYAATGTTYDSTLLLSGEDPCAFVDAGWAVEVPASAQRPLLEAALRATRVSSAN